MADNKTKLTSASVKAYLDSIEDESRRNDCQTLALLMSKAAGHPPAMWGTSIIGFGSYHYRYESSREGDMCLVGFSSRKGDISLYGLQAAQEVEKLLPRLGQHKAGKGCIYIKSLADVDQTVLKDLVARAVTEKNRQNQ